MGDAIDEKLLEKLTLFIQTYLPYNDRDLIEKYLSEHNSYHTIDYAIDDKGEIIGLVRWNMDGTGEIGYILDFALRPDFRNKGLFKHFILRALKTFPKVKYVSFKRERKARKEQRTILIDFILKHDIF